MEIDITAWKELLFKDNETIVHPIGDNEVVIMSYEKYCTYLKKIASLDKKLQNEFIVYMGNQLLDWDDGSASIFETARNMHIDSALAWALVSHLYGSIFRDFDDSYASFSPQGWVEYEELKVQSELI